MQPAEITSTDLTRDIKTWARELGFGSIGITGIDLSAAEAGLIAWLDAGFHGDMDYMARHGVKRARPAELVPGTLSVISARMDYQPDASDSWQTLEDAEAAYVSRYATGRDYHKLMRTRLQALADRIQTAIGPFGYRVFTDSAPVLEVELATQAGLGWRGKHTLLLSREAGSYFFVGEIYVNLALLHDSPTTAHCGSCERCIDICPTQAIVAPYRLDARRCLSYLTIEHKGSIPVELRPLLGNRVYGCDDCQLVCPWNKYAQISPEPDFRVRHGLDTLTLIEAFRWSEADFLRITEGSAIRRIGHERWLRNVAVALGNALRSTTLEDRARERVVSALHSRADDASELVREHVRWALQALPAARASTVGAKV